MPIVLFLFFCLGHKDVTENRKMINRVCVTEPYMSCLFVGWFVLFVTFVGDHSPLSTPDGQSKLVVSVAC